MSATRAPLMREDEEVECVVPAPLGGRGRGVLTTCETPQIHP
ncbi:hypothetical protein XHC_3726 [Xanthomonas hortorum pv. carotae str. M081]|nr:hypothetical protein XHC_3726 [Xanthomonas hortorum pv. carotae str. M081]